MPVITFYDGTNRTYKNAVSLLDVVKDISPNLVQDCIFGYVNGISVDKDFILNKDSIVQVIYKKDQNTLNIIRNSCIGLLGKAVKKLWPHAKIGDSSILENGFYCDIDVNFSFKQSDLKLLETYMNSIILNRKYSIDIKSVSKEDAYSIFKNRCETYKLLLLEKFFYNSSKKVISLCFHEEYVDFQKGIAVPCITFCRYFKLQKFSGVYWDSKKGNKVLQRIYGVSWTTKTQLEEYLNNVDQANKRDHRKISKILDLYHIQEDLPGMIFWHNNGWIIFQELEKFIRVKLREYEYQEVKTPLMMNKNVWKSSGHLDNYQKSMFMVSLSDIQYGIKPMNCPGHIKIFNSMLRSYRDLPIRISEFGSCHRNESSGSLHGLMRIRHFTQDDAHIFCQESQIRNEISNCIKMIYDVYKVFGFKNVLVKLSTRPSNRMGNDDLWDKAESDLARSLEDNKILFEYQNGEGAFYGPKIELSLLDSLNRIWQCATIQLDFYLPKNLNAFYIDKNNERKTPIIIHRAILGSIERFIGILIEEYSGNFPTWLAPVQVVITNIKSIHNKYVKMLFKKFYDIGIRSELDLRNEKINFKIREYFQRKIPYIVICGDKEVQNNLISVRTRSNKTMFLISFQYFIKKLKEEISNYNLNQMEE